MARIDFVSSTNDPRNTVGHGYSNPANAIDASLATAASSDSYVHPSGVSWRGLILELPSASDVASIVVLYNICGGYTQPNTLQTSPDGSTWTTRAFTSSDAGSGYRRMTLTGGPISGVTHIALVEQESGYNCWVQAFDTYADGTSTPTPPDPPPPPPITVTINGVVFENLLEMEARFELNGQGSFRMVLPKGHEQATEENLTKGNVVQLLIPQIHSDILGEFLLETGDFDLVKKGEEGEEELHFGGPGTLAYLKRAVMAWEQYIGARQECFPKKGVWIWENSAGSRTEGDIIKRMIEEAQSASRPEDPIPAVTRTFSNEDDSNGNPWGDEEFEGQWRTPIGQNIYDEVVKLARAGMIYVEMAPGMVLNAYRDQGRDLSGTAFGTGVVRFVKGVNITTELKKGMAGAAWADEAVIKLTDGSYEWAAIGGTFPYIQETYIETDSDNLNTARRQAQGLMRLREDAQEAFLLGVLSPREGQDKDVDAGLYLPGPEWSDNGDYWLGDIVTLHALTDDGEFQYDNADQRIFAITLSLDKDTGELAIPIVELNAPWTKPGQPGDLQSTGGSPSSSGGAGGSSGGGSGSHVHTSYQSLAERDQGGGYAALDDDGHLVQHVISPAQLTANTNDWNPTGLTGADIIRLSTDASRNITGIVAPAAGGRRLVLQNVGGFDAVLKHDVTSTAANRFYGPNSGDLTLRPNASVELVYDTTSDRWRVLDPSAGGGSSLTVDDGVTSVSPVDVIVFDGATVTDDGGGQVTVAGLAGAQYATVLAMIDGGGSAITTGVKLDIGPFDFACEIEQATLVANASGSIVLDIWRDSYANFPPVVGDSITASAKPTLSSATKAQDSTLTGWSTSIAVGDILRINVDSNPATVARVTLALRVRKV